MGKHLKKQFVSIAIFSFLILYSYNGISSEIDYYKIHSNNFNKDRIILYVGGSGPGNYTKIQDAIDNASDGDTVFVYDESSPYYENLNISRPISLIGENKNTTIIDGGGEDVICFSVDNVSISGFTIQYGNYGIRLSSSYSHIFENIVTDNDLYGIYMTNSTYNRISNNIIKYNRHGIYIYRSEGSCFYNNITNNTIFHNYFHGIQMSLYHRYNSIIGNSIIENQGSGIKICCVCNYNNIYHNTFKENGLNAEDQCGNNWDDGYPSGGNYWDDYNGTDVNGDGIGDTSYPVSGGHNVDQYPHIIPLNNHPPNSPSINGPNQGKVKVEYDFCFQSVDIDMDNISLFIDWGDGTDSDWVGPYESEDEVILKHSWSDKGEYEIKAKAKDIYGVESNWTIYEIFKVPKNKLIQSISISNWIDNFPLFQYFICFFIYRNIF